MMNRRMFLGSAASALRVMGANERLRIGVIGCGGMAGGHMRWLGKMKETDNCEIVAVCDIYDKRRAAAAQLTGGKEIKDYRALLSDKGIDYVLIATPEHWHYQMAKDALEAGKHVYVEKPMTQYAEQAKKLAAIAKTAKTKLQVGVQGMSDDSYAAANEHFKKGTLGKVVLAQIDYSRNHKGDFFEGGPDPDVKPGVNLDWNAFLGPAKKRPFDMDRFLYWRRYWDYSSGIASDLFIHRVTRLIKSLDLKFPAYGVGTGGKYCFTDSKAEIPDTQTFLIEYPEGLTVQLVSSMANETRVEHMLRGHKATLTFTSTGFVITPQSLYKNEIQPVEYKKTGAEALDLHHRNLMAAIREGAPQRCDADLGYLGVVATQLGVVSFRERKYTRWDAQKGKIQKL